MSNYPMSGIPLHMQNPEAHREKMEKGVVRLPQMPRSSGNDVLRRYPNGALDIEYVALKVIEVVEKMKGAEIGGYSGFPMTELEKAILSLIVPELGKKTGMSPRMAALMARISATEKTVVQARVGALLKEKLNWNVGRGGGSVDGRSMTIDKSMGPLQEYLSKADWFSDDDRPPARPARPARPQSHYHPDEEAAPYAEKPRPIHPSQKDPGAYYHENWNHPRNPGNPGAGQPGPGTVPRPVPEKIPYTERKLPMHGPKKETEKSVGKSLEALQEYLEG